MLVTASDHMKEIFSVFILLNSLKSASLEYTSYSVPISCSQDGDYENYRLLGFYAVSLVETDRRLGGTYYSNSSIS
jgi:hypothetical protein